jgi:alginate O-acetyltransferase complex protein AlgI
MYFTDFSFLIFLSIVIPLYWLIPFNSQNLLLLIASFIFYGFVHPWICLLMFGMGVVNFYSAILIEKKPNIKRLTLNICLIISLGTLAYFKYSMFFLENIKLLWSSLSVTWQVFLPAGISFYTFQALSYTIDVYRKEFPAEKSIIRFLLFKSFFPQLVAGPIERAGNLLNQINNPRSFSWEKIFSGVDLILYGFVKKLVVADNIALYVNMIFDLKSPSTLLIIVGTIGFSVQILADFSSYTDIARGSARMLGFELMENFKNPYLAITPSDFWRRWHISLSTWIRDYIYIPLGGSKVSNSRWVVNMFVVWFLCGLWHGAAWNFVAWGLYWCVLLIIYRFADIFPKGPLTYPFRIIVMYFLITTGWLFFRVDNLGFLFDYFSQAAINRSSKQVPISIAVLSIILTCTLPLFIGLLSSRLVKRCLADDTTKIATRILGYTVLLLLLSMFAADSPSDFYYFQF